MTVDFSPGSMQPRGMAGHFQGTKRELSTQNLISSQSTLQNESERKTFSDEGKPSEPVLKELLKAVLSLRWKGQDPRRKPGKSGNEGKATEAANVWVMWKTVILPLLIAVSV